MNKQFEIMENQTNKHIANATIKRNEAFHVLMSSTGLFSCVLQSKIIETLIENQLIESSFEDYGKTIQMIVDENDWTMVDFVKLAFPETNITFEILELMKSIVLWGWGDCPLCGCELESEKDGFGRDEWTETKCENPNCDYATTDEPNWD